MRGIEFQVRVRPLSDASQALSGQVLRDAQEQLSVLVPVGVGLVWNQVLIGVLKGLDVPLGE